MACAHVMEPVVHTTGSSVIRLVKHIMPQHSFFPVAHLSDGAPPHVRMSQHLLIGAFVSKSPEQ